MSSARWSARAAGHLDEIWAYVSDGSFIQADRVDAALREAADRLADQPQMGHTRADLTSRSVKFWRVWDYLLVYDPVTTPITIVAVLHGARDVARLLDEDGP